MEEEKTRKDTVRINLPPKPTRSPTVILPSIPPGYKPPKDYSAPKSTSVEKPKKFRYVAMDTTEKEVKGTLALPSQNEVIERLKQMGFSPTEVVEVETEDESAKEKAEEIARLNQIIENAKRKLAENKIAREKENLLIAKLRMELEAIKVEKKVGPTKPEQAKINLPPKPTETPIIKLPQPPNPKEEAEKLEREKQKRAVALEKDRKINLFKWFLIDKMSDSAFKVIFGKNKGEVSLEELNKKFGESAEKATGIWHFNSVSNMADFTPNGFFLELQNPEDMGDDRKYEGVIKNPKAKFKLISPDWKYVGGAALSHEEGVRLLKQKYEEYQAQQRTLFEGDKKAETDTGVGKLDDKDAGKRDRSLEEISTSEKVGNLFVQFYKNSDFYLDDFYIPFNEAFPEGDVKKVYKPTKSDSLTFYEKEGDSSIQYVLVTIGSKNYLLPSRETAQTFAGSNGFTGSAAPDKLKKIIPAEVTRQGKSWIIKTWGQLS